MNNVAFYNLNCKAGSLISTSWIPTKNSGENICKLEFGDFNCSIRIALLFTTLWNFHLGHICQ